MIQTVGIQDQGLRHLFEHSTDKGPRGICLTQSRPEQDSLGAFQRFGELLKGLQAYFSILFRQRKYQRLGHFNRHLGLN